MDDEIAHARGGGGAAASAPRRRHLEQLYRESEAAQRWLARFSGGAVANLTAILAVGAVVLYSAGLFRRIAQLRADGVQTLRGIPLAPLQTYFVDGIAILFNPNALVALLAIATLLAAVATTHLWWPAARPLAAADEPKRVAEAADAPPRVVRLVVLALVVLGMIGLPTIVLGLLLFAPPAEWAPTVCALLPVAGVAALMRAGLVPAIAEWTPFYVRAGMLAVGLTMILVVLLRAAFQPPPLDVATLTLAGGQVERGKLLTQSDGFVYLVGVASRGREASIVAVPVARIARMEVRDGPPRRWKSLAERVGVRLVHIELKHGQLKVRLLHGGR